MAAMQAQIQALLAAQGGVEGAVMGSNVGPHMEWRSRESRGVHYSM